MRWLFQKCKTILLAIHPVSCQILKIGLFLCCLQFSLPLIFRTHPFSSTNEFFIYRCFADEALKAGIMLVVVVFGSVLLLDTYFRKQQNKKRD